MKKRKLKAFVLPTLYVLFVGVLFVSIAYLGKTLQYQVSGEVPVINPTDDISTLSVIKEEEPLVVEEKPMKPFLNDSVKVSKSYYEIDDDPTTQANSLIYYEKTYLKNTGILYTLDEEFDVVSAYDGTVTNIGKDEILGDYIEITHNTNLKTMYYSVKNIAVKKDDAVKAGTIIAVSGDNMLEQESDNNLLFEVYYNGYTMNPIDFYDADITNLD